jgi:hypothetical protein
LGNAVESINPSYILSGNQVAINIDRNLNALVAHLLLNICRRNADLNQQRAESVAQIVKAKLP